MRLLPPRSGPGVPTVAFTLTAALATLATACGSGGSHPTGAGSAGAARPAAATTTTTVAPPSSLSATEESWRLPAAVSRPVVLPDGSGFVILGGLATGDVSTSRVVRVDAAAGTGQQAGSLAVAVHDSAGAVIGGRDYVFGGGSYSTVSTVQSWSAGAASEVAHLPSPRSDLTAITVGGTAYVVGGFDGTRMDAQVLATSDGTTFRPVATLQIPVRYAAVGYAAGSLWVFGGVTSTSESGALETSAIQRVDLATGKAAVVGHLPEAMGHATAVTLAGQVFVLGGRSGSVPSAAILHLDPAIASVTPAGTLPQALSDAGSVVVGDRAYLVGGEVSGPTHPLDSVVVLRAASGAAPTAG